MTKKMRIEVFYKHAMKVMPTQKIRAGKRSKHETFTQFVERMATKFPDLEIFLMQPQPDGSDKPVKFERKAKAATS